MNPCSASLPYKLRMRQFMKYRPQHAIAGNASCRYVGRTPRKMIGTLHSTDGPVEGLAAISAVDLYGSAELPACRLKNFVYKPPHAHNRIGRRCIVDVKPVGGDTVCELTYGEMTDASLVPMGVAISMAVTAVAMIAVLFIAISIDFDTAKISPATAPFMHNRA